MDKPTLYAHVARYLDLSVDIDSLRRFLLLEDQIMVSREDLGQDDARKIVEEFPILGDYYGVDLLQSIFSDMWFDGVPKINLIGIMAANPAVKTSAELEAISDKCNQALKMSEAPAFFIKEQFYPSGPVLGSLLFHHMLFLRHNPNSFEFIESARKGYLFYEGYESKGLLGDMVFNSVFVRNSLSIFRRIIIAEEESEDEEFDVDADVILETRQSDPRGTIATKAFMQGLIDFMEENLKKHGYGIESWAMPSYSKKVAKFLSVDSHLTDSPGNLGRCLTTNNRFYQVTPGDDALYDSDIEKVGNALYDFLMTYSSMSFKPEDRPTNARITLCHVLYNYAFFVSTKVPDTLSRFVIQNMVLREFEEHFGLLLTPMMLESIV